MTQVLETLKLCTNTLSLTWKNAAKYKYSIHCDFFCICHEVNRERKVGYINVFQKIACMLLEQNLWQHFCIKFSALCRVTFSHEKVINKNLSQKRSSVEGQLLVVNRCMGYVPLPTTWRPPYHMRTPLPYHMDTWYPLITCTCSNCLRRCEQTGVHDWKHYLSAEGPRRAVKLDAKFRKVNLIAFSGNKTDSC